MGYKNITLIMLAIIALTILSAGCSITVTKNIYNVRPKTLTETDSTTYVFQLGSQPSRPNDEQR